MCPISDRSLDNQTLEYKGRTDEQSTDVAINDLIDFLRDKLKHHS